MPRPRNRTAVVAFVIWLLVAVGSIGSIAAGFAALDDTQENGLAPLVFAVLASRALTPLAAIGLVVSLIAISRRDQAKLLAVVTLILTVLALLVLAPVFFATLAV